MFACGGDDGPTVTVKPDASGSGSGSGSGSQSACAIAESYGDIVFGGSGAAYVYEPGSADVGTTKNGANTLIFQAKGSDNTYFEVLILGGCGSGSGSSAGSGGGTCSSGTPDWPTTFGPKSGLDLGAPTADIIVAQLANLNAQNRFEDIYFHGAGTLNITSAGNGSGVTYAGNAANVQTVHVDLTTGQEAADGCQSAIQSLTFSGTTRLPAATGKQGTIVGAEQTRAIIETYLAHRHY
jgi:hypothetical protein